jgi:signal transduction histidine kinase
MPDTENAASPVTQEMPKPGISRPSDCHLYYVSTDATARPGLESLPPCCPVRADNIQEKPMAAQHDESGLNPVRINWQLKTLLPVAFVLLNGLLLFMVATVSLQNPQKHEVLVVAGTGAVVICAVLILALAFVIGRPMIELQDKIQRVGDGDLNVWVGFAKRNDDTSDLGRNFNRMVEQLRQNRDEIERLHRTQMSRAEHLATLGELATGLAHEIRNPLAGIAGVIEIIGRDLPATSPARAVVKEVRQEINQINRIVSDLLDTARPRQPQIRRSDLNATVEHAVMLARQQALSKPVLIDFKKISLPDVEHDSDQIHQVLLNLLLNSIQAIDAKGFIKVELEQSGDNAVITVADNGRGIAPEHLPNIFRPFYTTKGNGTGLGLSLARRIVEEHHGRIEATSSVGKGTTFVVTLPLQRPLAQVVA